MPHKLHVRPKSDRDARPFEIVVSDHTAKTAADARTHVEKHCPTLVVVEPPKADPAPAELVKADPPKPDAK